MQSIEQFFKFRCRGTDSRRCMLVQCAYLYHGWD